MDDLLKTPACSGDKISHLRAVYDKIHIHVRGLESLGVTADQYGSLLIPVIMSKLPAEVRLQVARVTAKEIWEVQEILTVIQAEVEAREISDTIKVTEGRQTEGVNNRRPTASVLVVRDGSGGKLLCVYCKGDHFSAACESFKDAKARKEILRKDGRCFLCLFQGHKVSQCTSKRRCRKCNRKHHQSICEPPNPTGNGTDSNEQENTENTTTSVVRTRTKVLLQTAKAQAYTMKGELITVRLLLDSGSQRSYITNHLIQRLQLKPTRRERLNLNTFGNEQFNKRECRVVKVELRTLEGDVVIEALGFPSICSPLPVAVEVDQYPHLQGLELADRNDCDSDCSTSKAIDILIGSDHYWEVVTGNAVREGNGPVAVSSKFGWILSGPVHANTNVDEYVVSNTIVEGSDVEVVSIRDPGDLVNALHRFWDVEAIGINEASPGEPVDSFPTSITFDWNQQRYCVCLLWKSDIRPQTDAFHMCVGR